MPCMRQLGCYGHTSVKPTMLFGSLRLGIYKVTVYNPQYRIRELRPIIFQLNRKLSKKERVELKKKSPKLVKKTEKNGKVRVTLGPV